MEDVHCFNNEGNYVYSWLAGSSARAAEQAPPHEIRGSLLSLLRTVTQDRSWRAWPEPYAGVSSGEEGWDSGWGDTGDRGNEAGGCPAERWATSTRNTSVRQVPSLICSTWNSNPLFRGSYSYIASGSSSDDIDELARSLGAPAHAEADRSVGADNGKCGDELRLMFAGEATHREFFSTAHGGFESGRRAAREVLESLRGSSLLD